MEFIQSHITFVATTLTLLSHIVLVLLVLFLLINDKFKQNAYGFVSKYVLELLFATSITAVVGSLAYSNIIGFPPCELCWIQRIFIYPQAVLAFIALLKKDKGIVYYLLPLSVLGGLVAFYHSLANWGIGGSLLGCTSVGGECSRLYVLEYGYITIPVMSLTICAYLIFITVVYYKSKNGR